MRLTGKVAIVTGAASGIGRAMAIAFAREGASLICADSDAEGVTQTSTAITNAGGRVRAIVCDVTNYDDIQRTVLLARDSFGRLDILLNAAGIMRAQSLLEITPENFRAVVDVNLVGLFFMLQAAAKEMIYHGNGGRIINIASIAGRVGNGGSLQYSASKAAVISVTQSAALELISHRINVNAIAPGYIQTAMWDSIRKQFDPAKPTSLDDALLPTIPAGRLGLAEDVVGAAVFLASAEANYVVGQTLNIDGGVRLN